MTQNQIAYWNYRELQRSNQARELENSRSNRARETETRRSNLATEKETARSNLARELETVRSNTARERETRRSNLAQEVEFGRHNAATEQAQRDANRISSAKVQYDADYRARQIQQDKELKLLDHELAWYKANTERAGTLNSSLSNSERNDLQREWNAVQAELQRLGIQSNVISNILNIFGRLGGAFLS